MIIINDSGDNSWYKLMSLGSTLSHKIQEDQEELFRLMQKEANGYQEYNESKTVVPVDKTKTVAPVETIKEKNNRLLKFLEATESLIKAATTIIKQVCVDLGIDQTKEPIKTTLKELSDGTDAVMFIYQKLKDGKELDEKQIITVLKFLEIMINSLNSINLEVK